MPIPHGLYSIFRQQSFGFICLDVSSPGIFKRDFHPVLFGNGSGEVFKDGKEGNPF